MLVPEKKRTRHECVWTLKRQILRRAGACTMFLFTAAPTHQSLSLFLFPFSFFLFLFFFSFFFFSTSTSSSFNSVHRLSHGRSILPVTWTLCGAASIKPHFYSGALHSLRSARLPPTFHGSLLHKRARVSRFFSAQPLEKYSNTHSRTPATPMV